MLRFIFTKSVTERERFRNSSDTKHGTDIALLLSELYCGTDNSVTGDSFFSSVRKAKILYWYGLRYIRVVKFVTRNFPIDHFSAIILARRVSRTTLSTTIHSEEIYTFKAAAFYCFDKSKRFSSQQLLLIVRIILRKHFNGVTEIKRGPIEAILSYLARKLFNHTIFLQEELTVKTHIVKMTLTWIDLCKRKNGHAA